MHDDRWIIAGLKPIQLGQFDVERYLAARAKFSTEEWIDLLVQSVGVDRNGCRRAASSYSWSD